MVRVLRVARTSVVRARAKAYNALQDLVVTAPAALREQLAGLYKDRLIHACEQLPEPETLTTPTDAVTVAIKSLAARCRQLAAWPKAKPRTRSCAASSATSPARSTTPFANPAKILTNSLPEQT